MQPQQSPDLSSEPSADGSSSAEQPSEQVEQTSGVTGFLQRLWRGRDGRFATGSEDNQVEEANQPAETSSRITLTQEELDRRIQAETDRREHKRAQEAQAERKRKLRDEDPWAYVEEERQAERAIVQDQQNSAVLGQIGTTHDRYTLDPLVEQLPSSERDRILKMEGAGQGLDGRKLIVTESLKALEKHWKEEGAKDAEQKLRRNSAFRKQVFSEFRRGAPEPEFINGGAASAADHTVSAILRDQLRARQMR